MFQKRKSYNATVTFAYPDGKRSAVAVLAEPAENALGFRVLRSAGHFCYEMDTDRYHEVWVGGIEFRMGGVPSIAFDGGRGVLEMVVGTRL